MDEADIAEIVRLAFTVTAKLAGPMLAVALIAGIVIAVLQAVTQINEATLVFVPKAIGVALVLVLLGATMFRILAEFARLMIDRMILVGGP